MLDTNFQRPLNHAATQEGIFTQHLKHLKNATQKYILDKGKKPEKSRTENEHEFMFSLVKNNFLLMLTVAAQAVCCEGVGIVDRMPVLEKQETSPHCSRRGISAQSDYCIRQPATLFCK